MKIAELFAELGFKTDSQSELKIKDFAAALLNLNLTSALSVIGLGEVGEFLGKVATAATKATKDLYNFNLQTGMSAKEMQQWSKVAEQVGVSAEDMQAAFKGVRDNIAAIQMGEGDISGYSLMGINPLGKSVPKILDEVRQKFKELEAKNKVAGISEEDTVGQERRLLQAIGANESMLNILRQEDDVYKSIAKQATFTTKQINDAVAANREWVKLGQDWSMGFQKAWTNITPLLTQLLRLKPEAWASLSPAYNVARLGQAASGGQAGRTAVTVGSMIFHINGGTDPLSTAKKIADEVKKALSDTQYQSPGDNQ